MNESHDQNVLIFYEQLDVGANYVVVGGDVGGDVLAGNIKLMIRSVMIYRRMCL